jgi:predicted MFS family arabinose efflux permease
MPVLVALGAAALLSTLVLRMTDPVVPILAQELAVPATDLAQLATAYALPYAIFQLVFGPLGDRYGKTRVVFWSVIGSAVFIVGTALAWNYTSMMVMRLACGTCAAAMIPLGIAAIGDRYAMADRPVMLSRFMLAVILGQVMGGILTGIAAEYMSWRIVFILYAGLALAIAVALHRLPKQPSGAPADFTLQAILARYSGIMVRPKTRIVITIVFVEGALFFGLLSFIPPYLAEIHHFGAREIGLVVAAYGGGAVVFTFVVGWLVTTLGPYRMIAAGGLCGATATALLAIGASLWVFMLLAMALGFSFYLAHNGLQARATELAPEARGSAVAIFACALFLGNAAGPVVVHPIVDHFGYHPAFISVAVGMIAFGLWASVSIARVERSPATMTAAPNTR